MAASSVKVREALSALKNKGVAELAALQTKYTAHLHRRRFIEALRAAGVFRGSEPKYKALKASNATSMMFAEAVAANNMKNHLIGVTAPRHLKAALGDLTKCAQEGNLDGFTFVDRPTRARSRRSRPRAPRPVDPAVWDLIRDPYRANVSAQERTRMVRDDNAEALGRRWGARPDEEKLPVRVRRRLARARMEALLRSGAHEAVWRHQIAEETARRFQNLRDQARGSC
jgi:hypothetical protein